MIRILLPFMVVVLTFAVAVWLDRRYGHGSRPSIDVADTRRLQVWSQDAARLLDRITQADDTMPFLSEADRQETVRLTQAYYGKQLKGR